MKLSVPNYYLTFSSLYRGACITPAYFARWKLSLSANNDPLCFTVDSSWGAGTGIIKNSRLLHLKPRNFSTAPKFNAEAEMVDVTFVTNSGTKHKTKGKIGDNLLDVVINNNIDLDGFGACEGTLACSTCHLVFNKTDFDKIHDKVTDEELDMLDLAYGLTDTSRLGCQVTLTKELDGMEVDVPAGVTDARS